MNTNVLFELLDKGADFSEDGKHRYALWRIWDKSLPLVMFIGLNPSTANDSDDDRTIESVTRLSKFNGYGGFYMMNCWAYIATQPEDLKISPMSTERNNNMLTVISSKCKDVVVAWGNFKIVSDHERDKELLQMFPNALCITRNKNGSPGHPLFKKGTTKFIKYQPEIQHY